MTRKRINKDYVIRWPIKVNGEVVSLVGMDLRLTILDPYRKESVLAFQTQGNVVIADFPVDIQKTCGHYHVTLWSNFAKEGQTAVDACDKIELVPESCMENDILNGLDNDNIDLSESNLEIGVKGSKGDDGATYMPHVDEEGNLSWTNDKGKENPASVNIKGKPGDPGIGVTHSFHGTELTMTSASGTTIVDLQGAEGKRGYSGNLNWPRMEINEDMELVGHVDSPSNTDRIYVDEEGYLTQII